MSPGQRRWALGLLVAGLAVFPLRQLATRLGVAAIAAGHVDRAAFFLKMGDRGGLRDRAAAEVAFARRQSEKALGLARSAVALAPDDGARRTAQLVLARVLAFDFEALDEAEAQAKAVERSAMSRDGDLRGRALLLRGDLDWWLRRERERACTIWREAAKELRSSRLLPRVEARLALAELQRGRAREAETLLLAAARRQRQLGDLSGLVESLTFLGGVHAGRHDAAAAWQELEAARRQAESRGDRRAMARIDRAVADWFLRRGDWRAARQRFADLVASAPPRARRQLATLLIDLGNATLHDGDVPAALAAYQRALDHTDDAEQRSTATLMIGHARLLEGKNAEALAAFDAAREWATSSPRLEPKVWAALALADAAGARGDVPSSLDWLDLARRLEASWLDGDRTAFFRPQYWQVWRRLEALLTATGDDWRLRRQIARRMLAYEEQSRAYPARLPAAAPEQLPAGWAALVLVGAESSTLALVARREGVDAVRLPLGEDAFDAKIRLLNALLRGDLGQDTEAWRPLARALDAALIEPLRRQHWLDGIDRLAVIGGKPFDRLPFAALLRRQDGGDRALIEDFALLRAPSLALLVADRPANPAASLPLVFARSRFADRPGLPNAPMEAHAVAGAWGPGARLLLDEPATETAFRAEAPGARLLHVATHGEDDPLEPLRSHLELAADRSADGRLTVAEILGLELRAELVVLSACASGRAGSRRGDELAEGDRAGLVDAFLAAGARRVLAPLETVDDRATAALMAAFYRELAQDQPPATAWANVQRRAWLGELGDPTGRVDWRQPRFWATFVLFGAE